MSESHNPVQQLEALRLRFQEMLPERFLDMESAWRDGRFFALQQLAHGLAGSSAIFGLSAVGETARAIERFLDTRLASGGMPGEEDASRIEGMLVALREAAEHSDSHAAPERPAAAAAAGRIVYLVEDDPHLARNISLQLSLLGYEVTVFDHPARLEAEIARRLPAAVIMDIMFPGGDLAGVNAVRHLALSERGIPVVFLSARDDFEARLDAVRAGAACYLVKPVEAIVLGDRLEALVHREEREPYRVLVVEDMPEQAEYYAGVLRQAGMLAKVAMEAPRAIQALSEFRPDLILMDMYLPNCSGAELARVVRQIDPYFSIPIVFLSVETDVDRQLEAIAAVGDEFLSKPIKPGQLVFAVTGRIQRYRALQNLMVRDGLTGLLNHSQLQQQIELEMARAGRNMTPLSLAMIDLDYFKSVNDRYGHPAGDLVLKNLSRFLRQRLRRTDIIGRYGGEEFSVVFPNTPGWRAREVMDRLREEFSTVLHQGPEDGFSVTMSVGIATAPAYSTTRDLMFAADASLYSAKREGRNRVVLDGGENTGKPDSA